MRSLATATVLLLALLGACDDGNSDKSDTSGKDPAASSSAPSEPATTDASDPTGNATGTPKTDPCDLLTKGMAEGALGVPVGKATRTPGEGNVTCSYSPADGTSNVFVLLTTYAASGEAALATATKAFPDAKPVPDLGDAALVSRQGHAIGVSVGDLLFGMSLLRADAFDVSPAVSEAQLITLAHTVVDSR
jgi:hypothetical protein